MSKLPQQTEPPPGNPSGDRSRQSSAARGPGRRSVPESTARSPLGVEGVDLDLTTDEIVNLVREGRERYG